MIPIDQNFYFPAEWNIHESTWLSFPHNVDTWEHRLDKIYPAYFEFIRFISESETVNINVGGLINKVELLLEQFKVDTNNVVLHDFITNDSWCRDHGPAVLINRFNNERIIVDWEYNAWGGKYPPYDSDNKVPSKIAEYLNLETVRPGIVMEGGSVEFNGNGTVMTSKACLLNKNRNPDLGQKDIEELLCKYYGQEQVLWINDGIVGDDTDGHIDDTVRFVSEEKVIAMIETNKNDENHRLLSENLSLLKGMRLINGKQLDIIEIQMPKPVIDSGERLPASYANFLITNKNVIVPTYNCIQDDVALRNIQDCFKERKVVGIDSREIIWGLGSFHCLSQQIPKANEFV